MSLEEVRKGVMGDGATRLSVVAGGKASAGKGSDRGPIRDKPATEPPDCPIVALGHRAGEFVFLDVDGQERRVTARQLGGRADLVSLFLGNTGWLMREFPKTIKKKTVVEGSEVEEETVVGFQTALAAEHLMRLAGVAGQYGPHVTLRHPGVWPDADGRPVVHCGDEVMIAGAWRRSGFRYGDHVWPSAPKTPRPAIAGCGAEVARDLQRDMQELWNFRQGGGAIVTLGLLAVGYYGAAAQWRSNGFLIGAAGSGKSTLLSVMRALSPMHFYTNDTTAAGMQQELQGRAMPSFVDQATDRVDQSSAQRLLDIVLSAAGDGGTQGHRGGQNGVGRTVSMISCIVMAATSTPDMQPQHRQRFCVIDLNKPGAGADHRDDHRTLVTRARSVSATLWARALEGWDRNVAALTAFRTALGDAGCDAREMDQIGAVLAGWWVLTQDGVPDERGCREGVAAVRDFIRGARETTGDDAPRRMIQHLASSTTQLSRSTELEQVGALMRRAYSDDTLDVGSGAAAREVLGRIGIRVIRADEPDANRGPAPRLAAGDGMWFAPRAETLRAFFRNSQFEGDRWVTEMLRLESARLSRGNVRVGGASPAQAIWLSRADWEPPEDHQAAGD